MNLVVFRFAVQHIIRISRSLNMPGGNILLVGIGGSGRQSLTRLAVYLSQFNVFQIEVTKGYGRKEWAEDIRSVLRNAGTSEDGVDTVFLMSDAQVGDGDLGEEVIGDVSNILNSGEVPNLFPPDEKAEICDSIRQFVRSALGKHAEADMTVAELYSFFVQRVRRKLHVVLAFSPIGDSFRDRIRKYPSLVNCCTIDWFEKWPSEALVAVAAEELEGLQFADTDSSDQLKSQLHAVCQSIHSSMQDLTRKFWKATARKTYVTPTSYLELLSAYKRLLALSRKSTEAEKLRYEAGLEKLDFAAGQVGQMQIELEELKPVLVQSKKDTAELMEVISQKLPGVEKMKKEVKAEADIAQADADVVNSQKKNAKMIWPSHPFSMMQFVP